MLKQLIGQYGMLFERSVPQIPQNLSPMGKHLGSVISQSLPVRDQGFVEDMEILRLGAPQNLLYALLSVEDQTRQN